MPSCFQLIRKTTGKPEILSVVDRELCDLLSVLPDNEYYVEGWFDVIGFLIATKTERYLGSELLRDEVIKWTEDMPERRERLLCILNYLEEHFTSESFYQMK